MGERLTHNNGMRPLFALNGRFLTRQTTGVDRFAREIIGELDKIIKENECVIVAPAKGKLIDVPELKNIDLVRVGKLNGTLWEQIEYPIMLRRLNVSGVNLCNTAPLIRPDIVCIHDVATSAHSEFYGRKFVAWYHFLFSRITKKAKLIITVSEFSKREIEKYYPQSKGKITVVSNGWQHIDRINSDSTVLQKNNLKPKEFWFAMSSLSPNKNLKWLVETARLNPSETIAIAGGINQKVFGSHEIPNASNVNYLGYVSDEEAKALMENCKGFLYPTFYEGFGIPPMEAQACGATAYVSDTEIMHEVYKESVFYLDPHCSVNLKDKYADIDKSIVLSNLQRYSWDFSTKELYQIIVASLPEEYGHANNLTGIGE